MLSLAADECAHGHIVKGLRDRVRGLDLVVIEEAGLGGLTDPQVLEWAAKEGRVLITQDVNTLVGYAWKRVGTGKPMGGVIVCGKKLAIAKAIDELVIIAECGESDDFKGQVRYLPL